MNTLFLIGEKVRCKNSIFRVVDAKFDKKLIIELDDEKKYDVKVGLLGGGLSFEDSNVQKRVEEMLKKPSLNMSHMKIDFDELSDDEAKWKLLEIWEEYGFEGFLHTTELENFAKIIKSKYLFSRNKADGYIDRADKNVIERTYKGIFDFCRFYYYFKTPTNYRANYKKPVILVFNKSLLFDRECRFVEGNAASFNSDSTNKPQKALLMNWEGVFERGGYTLSKYINTTEAPIKYITKIRNAEFLVKDKVDIQFIDKVYFKEKEDYDEAKSFSPEWMIEKFVVDRGKFFDD